MGGRGGSSHRGGGGFFGRMPMFQNVLSFLDKWQAMAYHELHNFSLAVWQRLMDAERAGVYDYTGSWYQDMNAALRSGSIPNADIASRIDNATRVLDRFKAAQSFWSYRGTSLEGTSKLLGGTIAQMSDASFLKNLIGKEVSDKGFMSTAVHSDGAWTGVKYQIYVPKGAHGMYVDPISANQGEIEFLLQKGTTFKVRRIGTNSSGTLNSVVLEVKKKKK